MSRGDPVPPPWRRRFPDTTITPQPERPVPVPSLTPEERIAALEAEVERLRLFIVEIGIKAPP